MPKNKMTIHEAIQMLTGPRSITDHKTSILGDGDMLALETLLKTYESQRLALAGLIGPSSAVLDEFSGLLDAGVLNEDEERKAIAEAYCDDLAMSIGKADMALEDNAQ